MPREPQHISPEEGLHQSSARVILFLREDPEFPEEWKGRLDDEPYQEHVLGKFVCPTPGARWWPSGTFGRVDGHLVLLSLELEPSQDAPYLEEPPAGGIKTEDVRALRVGYLLDLIRRELADQEPLLDFRRRMFPDHPIPAEEERLAAEAAAIASSTPVRRGRPAAEDGWYRQIAVELLALQREHGSQRLLHRFAELRGADGQPVPHETVRTWVQRARARRFLAPGQQGKAGVEPGPALTETTEV